MSRRRDFNKKEHDELQRLKHENQKLKRQVSTLRKQIVRIDIDRYENLKDLIHRYDVEETEQVIKKEKNKLKDKWSCFKCSNGFMIIRLIFRADGEFYFRKCTSCENRTKLKPYNNKVEGLLNEDNEENTDDKK